MKTGWGGWGRVGKNLAREFLLCVAGGILPGVLEHSTAMMTRELHGSKSPLKTTESPALNRWILFQEMLCALYFNRALKLFIAIINDMITR